MSFLRFRAKAFNRWLLRPVSIAICLIAFQNCGNSGDLTDERDGGFLLSSLGDEETVPPCQRLAAGLEQLGPGEFQLNLEDSAQSLHMKCLDHSGGKGAYLEILSDAANLDLHALFKEPTQSFKLTLVVAEKVKILSADPAKPALRTGDLPAESSLYLINHGTIQGAGGRGGYGGACGVPSEPGQKGGAALETSVPTEIENDGFILGGGGGGGGGGDICQTVDDELKCAGGGAGGGGAGNIPGFTGAVNMPSGTCDMQAGNFPAENGTASSGGNPYGPLAGRGGDPGEAGQAGRSHSGQSTASGQKGGAAGNAVLKYSSLIVYSGIQRMKGPIGR